MDEEFRYRHIKYVAEPTSILFHNSTASVRGLMGPVATGKSTAMVIEMQRMMQSQPPNEDGIRHTKFAVVRQTYKDLSTTVLDSFRKWFPSAICEMVESTQPMVARVNMPMDDGTRVISKVFFFPLDGKGSIEALGSLELSYGWLSEAADYADSAAFDKLFERCGRYPTGHEGTRPQPRVILEYNPPHHGSWLYNMFEVDKAIKTTQNRVVTIELFKVPPVLIAVPAPTDDNLDAIRWERNPKAEGVHPDRMDWDYWEGLVELHARDFNYCKRMVMGEYSPKTEGEPVFGMFKHSTHVAKAKLKPVVGHPLVCGSDFGFSPGLVVAQNIRGCVYIYETLQPENCTDSQYIEDYVLPLLRGRYAGFNVLIVADPSAGNRSSSSVAGRDRINICRRDYGLRVVPGYTNDPMRREDDVNFFLRRTNAMLIDPECTHLIEGMAGGYYREKHIRTGMLKALPEKNRFSHVADALQYLCGYFRKGTFIEGATFGQRPVSAYNPQVASSSFFFV